MNSVTGKLNYIGDSFAYGAKTTVLQGITYYASELTTPKHHTKCNNITWYRKNGSLRGPFLQM